MITFQKLTEQRLSQIISWFDDDETQKYLGDRDWIKRAIERPKLAVGKEFRGAKVIDRFGLVAYNKQVPISYIEIEVYDKYTLCSGYDDSQNPIIDHSEDCITALFVYTVAKQFRYQGYGKSIIKSLIQWADLSHIEIFKATTEPENTASEKVLVKNGFRRINAEPNFEDVYVWIKRVK